MDECVRYAQERETFGRKIGAYQSIQFTVADMEVRAHASRLAYYAAASVVAKGVPDMKDASMANSCPPAPLPAGGPFLP